MSGRAGMFDNYYSKGAGLKLYVRRVFISDAFDELLPRYLSFMKAGGPLVSTRAISSQMRSLGALFFFFFAALPLLHEGGPLNSPAPPGGLIILPFSRAAPACARSARSAQRQRANCPGLPRRPRAHHPAARRRTPCGPSSARCRLRAAVCALLLCSPPPQTRALLLRGAALGRAMAALDRGLWRRSADCDGGAGSFPDRFPPHRRVSWTRTPCRSTSAARRCSSTAA